MICQDTQIPPLWLNILDLVIVLVCFSYIFATLFIITVTITDEQGTVPYTKTR